VVLLDRQVVDLINECDHNGIITSKEVTARGFHRSLIQRLVSEGLYYQVSRGIYLSKDVWEDEYYLLQLKYPKGIFSHASALYLHGFSERVPLRLHMTFPAGYNAPSIEKENVDLTRVLSENYVLGIVKKPTPYNNLVMVYDLERSLCDVVRGSGDDIQIVQYAMKKYASSKVKDINKLMTYAQKLHVETKIRNYMEVLL